MNFQVMAASPAANISPLKFRGWLQRHVAQISAPSNEAQVILLVYVTPPLRNVFPAKKMAALLAELRAKNPAVLNIELFETAAPMTPEQLQAAVEGATRDIMAVASFSQSYGYAEMPEAGAPVDATKVLCVVSNIVPGNQAMLKEKAGLDFPLASWSVSMNSESGVVVRGPFETEDKAKAFATAECGANHFYRDAE